MLPDDPDAAYLRDMLDACSRIERFVRGKTLDNYRSDELLRSAVERQIEIIGEAARRLSEPLRTATRKHHGVRSLRSATFSHTSMAKSKPI